MKTCLALVLAAVTLSAPLSTVAPAAASDRPCVSLGEFNHLRPGQTKRQVETNWGVRGLAKWDRDRSTPAHDAYAYPSCNAHYEFKVAYARHTREWVWQSSSH